MAASRKPGGPKVGLKGRKSGAERRYIGRHRLDLLVEDKIVVELKAVSRIETRHVVIVGSYLAATGLDYGLILNFSTSPLEIRRVVRKGA